MTSDPRTRARELLAAATPGPWCEQSLRWILRYARKNDGAWDEDCPDGEWIPREDDAALIAAAPELLAAMLAELDASSEAGSRVGEQYAGLACLIHERSGLDDHHPNYSPEWAVEQMAESWAAESAALEAAEARVAKLEAALRPFAKYSVDDDELTPQCEDMDYVRARAALAESGEKG